MRACKECKEVKPFSEFYRNAKCQDGILPRCKVCTNKVNSRWNESHLAEYRAYKAKYQRDRRAEFSVYQRERKTANKVKAIELLGGKCMDCGESYPPYVYDFHHLDPSEKEESPANLFKKSWENILKELSKCVLLCSNCHRERHHKHEA